MNDNDLQSFVVGALVGWIAALAIVAVLLVLS